MQKEVVPSHKPQGHAYEYQNPVGLKEDNLSEKLPQSIESSRFVSHRERISGEFDSRKDSQSTEFEQRPWIFAKLSFSELCDSKLSGLHAFDNMVKIKFKLVKNRKEGREFMRHQSLK